MPTGAFPSISLTMSDDLVCPPVRRVPILLAHQKILINLDHHTLTQYHPTLSMEMV